MARPTPPPPRLHLLAARTEPVVVILRRGPSKWCHIIKYRTDTDTIERGSWFRGRIYHYRSDLSDDGRYMVYLALGERGDKSWNGICEPPRLTTVAHWENLGTYDGGGLWTGNRTLAMNLGGSQNLPHVHFADQRVVQHNIDLESLPYRRGGEDAQVLYPRLERDGWVRQGPFGTASEGQHKKQYCTIHEGDAGWACKPSPDIPETRLYYRGYFRGTKPDFEFQLPDYPGVLTPEVEWAAWDCLNQLIVARKGTVERWRLQDLHTGQPSFSLDLSNMTPPLGEAHP